MTDLRAMPWPERLADVAVDLGAMDRIKKVLGARI